MTLSRSAILSAALLVATSVGAAAQSGPPGPYLRGEGGLSLPGEMSARTGTAVSSDVERNLGYIVGGAAGYQFGLFRGELNVDYSHNGVHSLSTTLGGTTTSTGLSGSTSNLSVMVNGLFDIPLGLPVVPYIGAGVGGTRFSLHSIRTAAGTALVDKSQWGFALQPIVGVSYSITPNLSLAGEYRYFTSPDEPTMKLASGASSTFTNNEHHFLLSVTWHFGAPAAPPAAVKPAVAAPPAPPPAPPVAAKQMFIVFFEFDKSALTPDGAKVVDAAAAAFKSGKSGVAIAGYTDLAGTQQYNLALSHRRADTVKAALVRDGVPAAAIDESWHGKENPRVPTADGVREPQNRRVEITM